MKGMIALSVICWKLLINLSAWITLGRDPEEWALPFSFSSIGRCELPFKGRTGKLGSFSRLLIVQHVTKTARALPALWLMKVCTLLPPLMCATSRRGWDMKISSKFAAVVIILEAPIAASQDLELQPTACLSLCWQVFWAQISDTAMNFRCKVWAILFYWHYKSPQHKKYTGQLEKVQRKARTSTEWLYMNHRFIKIGKDH